MSTTTTDYAAITDSCCAKIVLVTEQAANSEKPLGTLSALMSPQNRAGFSTVDLSDKDRPTDDINGSMSIGTTKSFRRVYTEGIVSSCNQDTYPDDVCANPSTSEDAPADFYAYQSHTIDNGIKRELVLGLNGFKKFCKNPDQVIGDFITKHKYGVKEEINKKLDWKLISMLGEYKDGVDSGSSPRTLNLVNVDANKVERINVLSFAKIPQEFERIGAGAINPIIVGGGITSLIALSKQYFGGVADNGSSFSGIPNYYKDEILDVAFGDGQNHVLAWKPGTFQVATYNDINNDLIKNSVVGLRERMLVKSPFGDGFDWDLYVDVSNNGCRYSIKFQLWFDAIQPTVYDDCFTKPALQWLVACGDPTCAAITA